eukprot:6586065-Ditylum_brightwellii.AAC.1
MEDCIHPATNITLEFKLIMEQPSHTAQRDSIVRNSNEPGKLTIMLIGKVGKSSDSKEAKEARVRMRIQQSEGGGMDIDTINIMCKFKFCKTENIYGLKHQLKSSICFFLLILGKDTVITKQLSSLFGK